MKTPMIRTCDDLQLWDVHSEIEGRWVCCRPMPFLGLRLWHRLRCAWLVFTGKADVLTWKGGQ